MAFCAVAQASPTRAPHFRSPLNSTGELHARGPPLFFIRGGSKAARSRMRRRDDRRRPSRASGDVPVRGGVGDRGEQAAGAAAFWISRLRRRQRSERSASLALIRKASRPPRCSMVLRALALTRMRTLRCRMSLISVTSQRFGRNTRRLAFSAWLRRFPDIGSLPVSSHCLVIVSSLALVGGAIRGASRAGRHHARSRMKEGPDAAPAAGSAAGRVAVL